MSLVVCRARMRVDSGKDGQFLMLWRLEQEVRVPLSHVLALSAAPKSPERSWPQSAGHHELRKGDFSRYHKAAYSSVYCCKKEGLLIQEMALEWRKK